MAKPIKDIKRLAVSPEEQAAQDLAEVQQAIAKHKDAVLEAVRLLQGLQDRGILPLLNNLLAAGDEVLAILAKEASKPQNSQVIENIVQLALIVGSLDLERLKPLADGMNAGLQAAATAQTAEEANLRGLWKTFRDPEVQRALAVLLNLLKGMGQSFADHDK